MSKINTRKKWAIKFQELVDLISKDKGQKPLEIAEVAKGATDTLKKIIKFKDQSLFIKIGEKVDLENINYDNVHSNVLFLEKIAKYSGSEILVVPFYSEDSLDRFILKLDPGDKYAQIINVLNKTWEYFWNASKDIHLSKTTPSLDEYIKTHISNLFVQENVVNFAGSVKIDLKTISEKLIVFLKNNNVYQLPSIFKMINEVKNLISNFKSKETYNILGDFQPVNILIKNSHFKIIDLSNMTKDGDIAQDLGKFFNYFNRFFLVSHLRDKYLSKPLFDVLVKDSKKYIEIESSFANKSEQPEYIENKIFKEAEVRFAKKIYSINKDYNIIQRIKLYKFITNLITLKRHLQYEKLTNLLFFVLADSYVEILNEVKSS